MTTYLKLLTTTVYDGVGGVRDYIIKLKHYLNKGNEMKVELGEKFLKWLILESLLASFDAVKLTYNALKEEWTLGSAPKVRKKTAASFPLFSSLCFSSLLAYFERLWQRDMELQILVLRI